MTTASERQELVESAELFLNELPQPVRRRVSALKKLQLSSIEIETNFYRQLHELECQFAERLQPLSIKRTQIVTGEYEPTDEECAFQPKSDEPPKPKENGDVPSEKTDEKGIPEFWLTVFKNNMLTAEMIEEADEAILAHLHDVTFELSRDPMGFKLCFHFSPNDFFTNTILTKEYSLKCEADKIYPFDFEGPEIVACKGCNIDWKAGKNITVKTIKRKQKHKTKGDTRVITQTVRADSFFNFFAPPNCTETDEMDEETRTLLNADFEIGQIMRDRIIPRAVLYFTGEATDDDDYDDEDDEELEDEDEEDEEEEEEEKPTRKGKGGGRH